MGISQIGGSTSSGTSTTSERGTDFLRWDMIPGEPLAYINQSTATTFVSFNGRPCVAFSNTTSGSTYTPFVSLYGPKNTDGVLKSISVIHYIAMGQTNNTTSLISYLNSQDNGTRFLINWTPTTWNIQSNSGSTSPTLAYNTWYRITQNYLPGTSCDLSYALATSTTDTPLGTASTTTTTGAIDNFIAGQAPLYVGRRTLRWS